MKNFIQPGNAIDLVAPSGGVTSGVGLLVGALFVVAACDAAEGETFSGYRSGVFELAAEGSGSGQDGSTGDVIYWDISAKQLTMTDTDNIAVGVLVKDKVTTDTTATIVLIPRMAEIAAAISDLSISAVTGVDGTGNNAASKADVDAAFAAISSAVNNVLAALRAFGIVTP